MGFVPGCRPQAWPLAPGQPLRYPARQVIMQHVRRAWDSASSILRLRPWLRSSRRHRPIRPCAWRFLIGTCIMVMVSRLCSLEISGCATAPCMRREASRNWDG